MIRNPIDRAWSHAKKDLVRNRGRKFEDVSAQAGPGVLETVALAEIVEDALRMHHEALLRHQIQVVREFHEVPTVTIDRHKLLQILFNLLENAKHACEDSGRPDRQVRVSLHQNGQGRIEVAVSDNGIGIPAENLTRIFVQEFSTRKGGHGFGLHSSLMAAQDLGGSLTAASAGPNASG